MALADQTSEGSTPLDALRRAPVVRVGRRFLPVAATALPPVPGGPGVVALPVAPGTPVHAMRAGRVAAADASIGEVDLRIDDDIRLLYRRLLPASVTLATGDTVESGDVIGIVAPGSGGRLAALELGVQLSDGSWEPVSTWLVGAPDPLELYVSPPEATVPVRARPRRSVTTRRAPVRATSPDTLPPVIQTSGSSGSEDARPCASKLTSRRHKVRAHPGAPAVPPESVPERGPDAPDDPAPSAAGSADGTEVRTGEPGTPEPELAPTDQLGRTPDAPDPAAPTDRIEVAAPSGGTIPLPVGSMTVPSGKTTPADTTDEASTRDDDQEPGPGSGTTGGPDRAARASRLTGRRRPRRSGT